MSQQKYIDNKIEALHKEYDEAYFYNRFGIDNEKYRESLMLRHILKAFSMGDEIILPKVTARNEISVIKFFDYVLNGETEIMVMFDKYLEKFRNSQLIIQDGLYGSSL